MGAGGGILKACVSHQARLSWEQSFVEGEPLTEGATVTVLAPDDDETFDLTPEEELAAPRIHPRG